MFMKKIGRWGWGAGKPGKLLSSAVSSIYVLLATRSTKLAKNYVSLLEGLEERGGRGRAPRLP